MSFRTRLLHIFIKTPIVLFLEPEGSGSTKPLNAAPKVVGLPPTSSAKSAAAGKGEDADEGSLSARTISPRSLSSADSRHGDVVQQNKSGTKAHNKETGKKKDVDSSDDEWETEPSQPSQKLQTVKDHLSNAAAAVGSEKKPDNRQVATTTTTAALTSSDAIYATVNKNTKADQQKRKFNLHLLIYLGIYRNHAFSVALPREWMEQPSSFNSSMHISCPI